MIPPAGDTGMTEPRLRTWEARERVLALSLRLLGSRIDDRPPGPHDDADAEYAEDELAKACAAYAECVAEDAFEKDGPNPRLAGFAIGDLNGLVPVLQQASPGSIAHELYSEVEHERKRRYNTSGPTQ